MPDDPISLARQTRPLVTHDEVKGVLGHSVTNPPDRIFYLLEQTGTHDLLWEADGYVVKDGKTGKEHWAIHIICPKCRNANTIKSEKKAILVHPEHGLEVDEFRCTWPGDFGQLECGYSAALVLPRGSQRLQGDQTGTIRPIDAVFRRA